MKVSVKSFAVGIVVAVLSIHAAAAAEIVVEGLWIRETAGAGKITGGFGTIRNTGNTADDLISASTPAAAMTQIHSASHEGGVMRMDQVQHLDIPANGVVSLIPGAGHHLMLMGVSRPLKAGDQVEVTLTFRNAGPVKAMAVVRPLGTQK